MIKENSEEIKKKILGLQKQALRDTGKILRKEAKKVIPAKRKNLRKHIATWVRKGKNGMQLDIGYYSWQTMKKKSKEPSHFAPAWQESGVKPHKIAVRKKKILTNLSAIFGKEVWHPGIPGGKKLAETVMDKKDEFRKAQQVYLSQMNAELSKISDIQLNEVIEDD